MPKLCCTTSDVDFEIDETLSKELDTLLIVCAKNLCLAFLDKCPETFSENFHVHCVKVLLLSQLHPGSIRTG